MTNPGGSGKAGRPDNPVGQTHDEGTAPGRPENPVGPELRASRTKNALIDGASRDRIVAPTGESDTSAVKSRDRIVAAAEVTTKALLVRKHHLPHWQFGGSMSFITFRSARGALPETALQHVIDCVNHMHNVKYELWFAVVMPDHVHLLIKPLLKEPGVWHDLSEVLKGLKGVSARRINRELGTRGKVWQAESLDRIVRNQREFDKKLNYMYFNPVTAGLVDDPEKYKFTLKTPRDVGKVLPVR